MTPQEFIHKWKRANLSERSGCQQHFLDLCELLNQPKPAEVDSDGSFYTFERGVTKTDGKRGWADVWMRGHFAWEYKKKHKDLTEAYKQLQLYRDDLESPPLLIVCDIDRFEIHTNFTNTAPQIFRFSLLNLGDPASLDLLRKIFTRPDALRPQKTTDEITQEIAEKFAELADGMRGRKIDPHRAAHFLMKLMFCMFAEDIELLQGKLFERILNQSRRDPKGLSRRLKHLFEAMAKGGEFGADVIRHFNGGLFKDADVIDLTWDEIEVLIQVNDKDWSNVEPSIFGTLFERTLDPAKRAQIGAHYTSRDDILTLLEPVLMAPLRREWEAVKAECIAYWPKVQEAARKGLGKKPGRRPTLAKESPERRKFAKMLLDFLHRLATVKILDPACGSGNFLYVAINLLLDLEKQVIAFASTYDFSWFPRVRPTQLLGIEINPFAQELAQVVIWIGYLQWMQQNGFVAPADPVLEPFENIQNMDAILDLSDPENPKEPEWPAAEFIVGNPPFLGDKKMRGELGDEYVEKVRELYEGRLPGQSDLCCYWFEKARRQIELEKCKRAGLLATQGIRGGGNRTVLDRIKQSGDIFWAMSDRDWILDGATVHVSMVGFHKGDDPEPRKSLDGEPVDRINPNLTSGSETTTAKILQQNQNLSFLGSCKGGNFDIDEQEALVLLNSSGNPHGRPNSDVIRPVQNSKDTLTSRVRRWIIDNADLTLEEASLYEKPHEIVVERVKPARDVNRDAWLKANWWRPQRMRLNMRKAVERLDRFIVTTTTSKHRIFVYLEVPTLPDHQLIVFSKADYWFFGIVHSKMHEVWAVNQGTQLRERESGFRYTPTTCFETFPFPEATEAQRQAIAEAAKELDQLRSQWLNPPEWTKQEILGFPGTTTGPWSRYVHGADARGLGAVRYPRLVPKDEDCARKLQKRTLTNLYNERPTWLALAHLKLDAAVAAAYGWPADLADEEILERLLKVNLE
jgi:hypothetical protein